MKKTYPPDRILAKKYNVALDIDLCLPSIAKYSLKYKLPEPKVTTKTIFSVFGQIFYCLASQNKLTNGIIKHEENPTYKRGVNAKKYS